MRIPSSSCVLDLIVHWACNRLSVDHHLPRETKAQRRWIPESNRTRDFAVPERYHPSGSVAGLAAGDRSVYNNLAFESLFRKTAKHFTPPRKMGWSRIVCRRPSAMAPGRAFLLSIFQTANPELNISMTCLQWSSRLFQRASLPPAG